MSKAAVAEVRGKTAGLERIPFGSEVAGVARIVARDGGVVLTGALTRQEVDAVNTELDVVLGPLPEGNFGEGEENFLAAFMGARTKRMAHCVKYSKTYRDAMLGKDILSEYIASILPGNAGTHSLYASQGIEIFPGEKAQELHRDGRGLLQALGINHPKSVEILVNCLLALTDVTEEMGATRIIPGSHLWDDFSVPGTQDQTVPVILNAGDMLFFSGKLLHGGGANTTVARSRRVISTAFAVGFFMGEEAWPFVIPLEEARTYPKRLQAYLGFRSVSYRGEEPGFLWRVETRPLEEHLGL